MMRKSYQLNHTHRAFIMFPNLLTGCPPCCLGPLGLLRFIRESVSAEDKAGIFVHGIEQRPLNTILVVCSLRFGAWSVPFTKWCRRQHNISATQAQ